ncbi:bumetanide-sensitive sodium-(potassium)-chloride cotransporter-like [Leguminivora glycinivorella]|uniref:bumetanide-sensitive sodium-(potassium)-chloride cotransporter-like n=1 Tax=Leguminivora glycinivorella TaxID=1035111 RepID=UPI00200F7254|nr:bumetanide-sensitive sodium-(potassium)-chloride cotransporter-like [Leguminivora glycinivorella]
MPATRKKQDVPEGAKKGIIKSPQPRRLEPQASLGSLQPTPELTTYGGIKLGWIQGVLIPCLLNIWGVMLFLRISWIVAQAGTLITMGIILVSGVVCVITTLSLSAICTNGELKGGGVYYLVSRSLGAELGASVGVIFAFANAVAASMNTIGFCDSLNDLLRGHGLKILDNGVNDTRIVGAIALLVMCLICAVGMDWETKTQNFLITMIVLAITNYVIGVAKGPSSNSDIARGFIGVSAETMKENSVPNFRYAEDVHHNVFTVFAMYFPAVTGVQAGANICGDLRNPATAIPKGTLLALLISMCSYALIALLCGAGALRDASGDASNVTKAALAACAPNCEYGLHNDYEIMQKMSLWAPLIYGGCWAATLSTALTNLLSVPRLIQALGIDHIYPGLIFFSKPYGKHGEPYRGYVLTFLVSLLFLLIADLNAIAPLITNFYLASYALINFCTFHAAFVHHISWRPTFRFYNMWVSLLGTVLCGAIMVLLSWMMAMVTVLIFLVLYLIVHYRKPVADWGSSTEAQRYGAMLQSLREINQKHSVKSYNPQILVLAGPAGRRPALMQVAGLITGDTFSLLAEIHQHRLSPEQREARIALTYRWLSSKNATGFATLVDGTKFEAGARALVQAAGLGGLAPNILLLGFKYDWAEATNTQGYVNVIRLAFEHNLGVTILRTTNEYRASDSVPPSETSSSLLSRASTKEIPLLMYQDSDFSFVDTLPLTDETAKRESTHGKDIKTPSDSMKNLQAGSHRTLVSSGTYNPMQLQHGKLDAWWLYDDGGLNILLPYIIATRGSRQPVRLRIFALARHTRNKAEAEKQLKSILLKYRISYASLTLLSGVGDTPAPDTWDLFHSLIHKHSSTRECLVQEADLRKSEAKTSRHLRLRELLFENSASSSFVVMNLPKPRESLPAPLYMAWLEMLSRDMPPMLFVRGNDQPVLTHEA